MSVTGISTSSRPDLLAAIMASTRRTVEVRAAQEPLAVLEQRASRTPLQAPAFRRAVSREGRINLIAECKRRSPSRGLLRKDYDAVRLATTYEAAGAVAVSVLTEPTFFDGSLGDLASVCAAVSVPVLRKDFVIDHYQVVEARAAGAHAVLLIVAALEDHRLRTLLDSATACGLDALVEVHDEDELDRALEAGASIVGVNSRNLRTLDVDPDVCERLAGRVPGGVLAIAESGLRSGSTVARLRASGFHAFLVGEHFVTSDTPGDDVRRMLDEAAG